LLVAAFGPELALLLLEAVLLEDPLAEGLADKGRRVDIFEVVGVDWS
jgi:hypothetical protein